jgi:hypothetical protein
MLRDYLEEYEQAKAEGNTIANLRIELHQVRMVQQEQSADIQMLKLRVDRHGRAIREIKSRFDANDGESIASVEHDTGVHQVADLRKHLEAKEAELKEHRDSVWWRRQKVTWLVASIGFGVAGSLGGLATVLWYLLTHGSK